MLEMRAFIISVEGEHAVVQPVSSGGCGHCNSAGGCGSGTLSKLFCTNHARHFKVLNQAGARVGDEVQVSIPDGMLFRGTLKMYIIPLILLLLGGVLGVKLTGDGANRDAYAVAGALTGLILGFLFARLSPRSGLAVVSSVVTTRFGS